MDIISLLGLISSVTGIISFVLYFVDKNNASAKQLSSYQGGISLQNWKFWMVITLLSVAVLTLVSVQRITGIQGDNNDGNQINISPGK
jgi:hypothetical protein